VTSRWLHILVLVLLLARSALAQQACPDLPSYRSALSLHHYWMTSACMDEGSADCQRERAAIAKLEDLGHRCEAGQDVGPAPNAQQLASMLPPPDTGPRIIGLVQLAGGGHLALADHDWRGAINASPTLALAAGGVRDSLGGQLAVTWAPERLTSQNAIIPGTTIDRSMQHFRILAEGFYELRPVPQLAIDPLAGIGADVVDVSFRKVIVGQPMNASQTDVGLALEIGVAAWWSVGDGFEVGGALAFPIGLHSSSASDPSTANLSYTGGDLQLLLGLRAQSGH
jgi:hypothetical protein